MLDNKSLNPAIIKHLSTIPYQEMVKIYDAECAGCPFKLIQVDKGKGKKLLQFDNISDAIEVFSSTNNSSARILRGCNYADNYKTLREIIMNTCRLWKSSCMEAPQEDELFITIEVEDETTYESIRGEINNLRESIAHKAFSQ